MTSIIFQDIYDSRADNILICGNLLKRAGKVILKIFIDIVQTDMP